MHNGLLLQNNLLLKDTEDYDAEMLESSSYRAITNKHYIKVINWNSLHMLTECLQLINVESIVNLYSCY